MAFDISYIFRAKDAYSNTAKKVAAVNVQVKKTSGEAAAAIVKKNTALRNLKASLLVARRRLRDYRKEADASATATGVFTSKVKQFAAVALAGLGLSKILQEGAQVEDAIADLSAITGAAGNDLAFLKSQVKALSVESRTMPADVAMAFKAVASAKSELLKDPAGLTEVTRQVLLLKNAAGVEMAQAVDVVTASLNQFNEGADQAGRFVNVLAAGSKIGASEVYDTAEAVVNAGVAAKMAKMPFETFNALIQVMAKNGIKGARAGTEINALVMKMEAKMGSAAPSVIGMANSLDVLQKMNLNAGDAMKTFGLESVDVLNILTSSTPLLRQWTEELTGTDTASRQAAARMSTFNSELLASRVRLVNIADDVFTKTRPALSSLSWTAGFLLDSLDPATVEVFSMALSGLGKVAEGVALVIKAAFELVMVVVKPIMAVLKGLGGVLGQTIGALVSGDFSKFDLSNSFDLGGKFLGLFGGAANDRAARVSPAAATASANATVNGQIMVSASKGSQIDSITQGAGFNGPAGNVGIGAAG